VAANTTQINQALSTFVSDYNTALSAVNSQFTFSTSTGAQGALSGDTIVRNLQSTLEGVISYNGASGIGSSGSSGGVQTLADLGITMNDDGTLSLDSSTLDSALANPSAVQSFFQGSALNGFAAQFNADIAEYNDPATGSITNEVSNLNSQYSNLQSQVNDYESGYIAPQQTILTAMYSQAEIALQELPTQMQEIQQQLGNNNNSNN
jgi:flagellar hook-associated protein 2